MSTSPPARTGLVCPECKAAVGRIEYPLAHGFTLFCPACGHRWIATETGAPKQ